MAPLLSSGAVEAVRTSVFLMLITAFRTLIIINPGLAGNLPWPSESVCFAKIGVYLQGPTHTKHFSELT